MLPPNLRNLIQSIQDSIGNVLGIANNATNAAQTADNKAVTADKKAETAQNTANLAEGKASAAIEAANNVKEKTDQLSNEILSAITAAEQPSGINPFATIADLPAPLPAVFTGEVVDAIEFANAPESSNPFATIADLPALGGYDPGYKEYIALVRQSGTNAPTATILKNTLDQPVVFNYVTVGSYTVSCDSITANKATVNGQYPFIDGGGYSNIHTIWQYLAGSMTKHCYITLNANINSIFGLSTKIDTQYIDGILSSYPALIHIRVYHRTKTCQKPGVKHNLKTQKTTIDT